MASYRISRTRGKFAALAVGLAVAVLLGPVLLGFGTSASGLLPSLEKTAKGAIATLAPAARPFPLPPVQVQRLSLIGGASVNPTGGYPSEPAPMGIGDFGVGSDDGSYSYSTTEFLGNFSWQSMNFDNSGNTEFSDQLNVVLQFQQDGITYAYWIQDVAFMDSSSKVLQFENNIWNMTTSQSCLDSSALSGNGTVYSTDNSGDPCQGYYAVSPASSLPGYERTMGSSGDFGLLVRSYQTSGKPEVSFAYWDGVTSYYVVYDNVVWPWATAVSSDNNFLVDGAEYNPGGWFYDAELAIGGPGGGLTTISEDPTHISSRLLFWNGHNFEAPPSVWNFGANTAETVSNVQSIFSNDGAGLPLTVQLNGTARNASPDQAYVQHQVGTLAITATGISSGTVGIRGDTWSFVNGAATLTLVPGSYVVWVNSTSGQDDLGTCTILADTTTAVSTPAGCGPAVSTPNASPGSDDLGQSVTFTSTLVSPGAGGDTYAWQTAPSGLGCSPSTSLTLSCTPASAGTYRVNLTVTDSSDQSSTSANRTFEVYDDPSVGTPSPSQSSVETGESVTFTASPSGGTGSYGYSWTGLPGPCSGTSTASPSCTPSSTGTYPVQVSVTDSNGEVATSPDLSFSVNPGPSVSTPTSSPVATIDLGQSVTFSAIASGGTGVYHYTWSGLPSGCSSASSANISCRPQSVGTSAIHVSVVDSNGGSATSGVLSFTVDSDPSLGALAASPASVDVGATIHFSSSGATGGAGGYRYSWTGLPSGCSSVNASDETCTAAVASSGVAELTVIDQNGGNNSTTVAYHIFSDPVLGGISSSRSSADLQQNVTFAAEGLSGGTGIYSYRWSGLPAGCTNENLSSITCAPEGAGAVHLTLTVTDSNGASVVRSLNFTVFDRPVLVGPSANPVSVVVGHTVTFSANASGGSGEYTFLWTGLPTGCLSSNTSVLVCVPSASGSFNVTVTATDSNGIVAQGGTLTFSVTSPAATFLGLPVLEGYAVLAGFAAIVVAAVVVIATRARRRRQEP